MNIQHMANIFYHRVLNATTDTGIIDAAKEATDGKPELLADFMFELAAYKKINITTALEQYRSETTAAKEAAEKEKQKAAQKKQAADIIATAGAYTAAIDTGSTDTAAAALKEIRRGIDTLETDKAAKNIYPALADIFAEWDAYDPEKDFRPPLLQAAIKDGTLSYIGARTGIGKTTALINITREALDAGRKVIFLTLEEPTRDILRKLILCDVYATAADSRETLQKLAAEKGDLTAAFHYAIKGKYVKGTTDAAIDFKQRITETKNKIAGLYGSRLIFIEGRSIDTAEKTTAAIIRHAAPGDIVLVDFIQRIADPEGATYTNYMKGKAQSETLFSIAKNTGAAVISGAQFKREKESEQNKTLAPLGYKPFDETSFREAGDIEQDGDYLFGIGDHTDAEATKRYIKIMKVRSGAGRGRCYAIDFQGAYNYMGIGERLTQMNPGYIPKPGKGKKEKNTPENFDWDGLKV